MNKATRQALFERFAELNPNPKTELVYNTPFELLIAVMLSAQATDVSVNKATGPLYKIANTPEAIRDLGIDKLKEAIKTINLYPTKAKHILKTCDILIAEYNSTVPQSRSALETLPGVGRKTANVVLNVAFNEPTMAVDTHIFRVSNRLGLAPGKTPRAVEDKLLKNVPKPFLTHAHHWLILHGRYICKAKNPQCDTCPVAHLCDKKGL